MHLCRHIMTIYRHELEKSNSLAAVNVNYSKTLPAKHIVFFDSPLGEYDDAQDNYIKKMEAPLTPHALPARGYLCLKCGCCVLGPLDANQKEWYFRNISNGQEKKKQTITATPQNIYWEDDTSSGMVFPDWLEYDDFCCTPDEHPSTMRCYYDLDADALPGFDDVFQSFTLVADILTEIFAFESRDNEVQLITVTDIDKTVDSWQMILSNVNHTPCRYVRKSKDMTTAEVMAFREVVRVFEACRYGRLRYVNVLDGQVSFVSVQGYAVIYKENGGQPNFEFGLSSEKTQMNIEQLRENWYHTV